MVHLLGIRTPHSNISVRACKALYEDQSRYQGKLQTLRINGSRTHGYKLTFDPFNQAIKGFRREWSNDQVHFMLIKSLDPSCNISDNPYIAFSFVVNQSYPVILLPYLFKKNPTWEPIPC